MDDYIDKVAVPQVKELLSNYGEFPAVLWWDTPCDMNKERADKLAAVLKLKPGIIYQQPAGRRLSRATPKRRSSPFPRRVSRAAIGKRA